MLYARILKNKIAEIVEKSAVDILKDNKKIQKDLEKDLSKKLEKWLDKNSRDWEWDEDRDEDGSYISTGPSPENEFDRFLNDIDLNYFNDFFDEYYENFRLERITLENINNLLDYIFDDVSFNSLFEIIEKRIEEEKEECMESIKIQNDPWKGTGMSQKDFL